MSYTFSDPTAEVVGTTTDGAMRVLIQQDVCAYQPDGDGGPVIVEVTRGRQSRYDVTVRQCTYGTDHESVMLGHLYARVLDYAEERYSGRDIDAYEARAMHMLAGVVRRQAFSGQDSEYVALITNAHAVAAGVDPSDTEAITSYVQSDHLTEWRAYVEGDVYGVIVQRAVTYASVNDPDDQHTDWQDVDSVWGHYGRQYAAESAVSVLDDNIDSPDILGAVDWQDIDAETYARRVMRHRLGFGDDWGPRRITAADVQ